MPKPKIDAALRSPTTNECYIFVEDKYAILNYASKNIDIISGPRKIVDGFPMFANTIFANGIDCAFENEKNEAFIFSRDLCAKITVPQSYENARLLIGPIPIIAMFPTLKGTVFEYGIEASMKALNRQYVYLFKGDEIGWFRFEDNSELDSQKIFKQFPSLTGTVFELGFDAAFNTHDRLEVFIFKEQYYAQYNIRWDQFVNGMIKRIEDDDWPALHSIFK